MNLPIDTVPNTNPPQFRWRQVVNTPIGDKTVDHVGSLPPQCEVAVGSLIGIAKQAIHTGELLRKERDGMREEVVALKAIIARQLDELEAVPKVAMVPQSPVSVKKGKA